MRQRTSFFLALFLFLVSAASLHAQGGCADSPEASTDVLMLVGSIGMVYGSAALRRIVHRRRS